MAAVFCFASLGILFSFIPKIHEQKNIEARLQALKATAAETRARRDLLRNQKVLLYSDAEYIEQAFRDRMNVKKPEEEIFHFADGNAPLSPARPTPR